MKIILGPKRTITCTKLKSKKLFLGEEIKQKETQMGPHRGSQDDPATGDKKFQGSKKDDYQLKIEIKETFSRGRNKTVRDHKMIPHTKFQGSKKDDYQLKKKNPKNFF